MSKVHFSGNGIFFDTYKINKKLNNMYNNVVTCAPKYRQERVRSQFPTVGHQFPKVNISKSESGYSLAIAVPGYAKEHLSMQMEKDTLHIRGNVPERSTEDQPAATGFHIKPFELKYQLSDTLNGEQISATYVNGILTVSIPFNEKTEKQPTKINIQ